MKRFLIILAIMGILLLNNVGVSYTLRNHLVTQPIELYTIEIRKRLNDLLLGKTYLTENKAGKVVVPKKAKKQQVMTSTELLNQVLAIDHKFMELMNSMHEIWRMIRETKLA